SGCCPSSPADHHCFVVRAQFFHSDVQVGKCQAKQRRANLDRFGTTHQIRNQPIVVQVIGGEQVICHVEIAAIHDRINHSCAPRNGLGAAESSGCRAPSHRVESPFA